MKRTHQEVDEILKIKESKEYIRDLLSGKKDTENLPDWYLKQGFEKTKDKINEYVPDLVNTKWIPDIEPEK